MQCGPQGQLQVLLTWHKARARWVLIYIYIFFVSNFDFALVLACVGDVHLSIWCRGLVYNRYYSSHEMCHLATGTHKRQLLTKAVNMPDSAS